MKREVGNSQKSGPDPVPVLDRAIKALSREVAVLTSTLRRESDWERVARRKL